MGKRLFHLNVCFFLALVLACASENSQPYWELPVTENLPTTDEERQEKCARIRAEISRQQYILSYSRSRKGGLLSGISDATEDLSKRKASKKIAWLESRAAAIGCRSAFSDVILKEKHDMTFDECFKKCKELTKRSNEECFDACSGR